MQRGFAFVVERDVAVVLIAMHMPMTCLPALSVCCRATCVYGALSINPPACLPVNLSVCLVCLHAKLSIYYLSVCLYVCQSVCLPACLRVCMPVESSYSQPTCLPGLCLSPSACLPVCLPVYLPACLSVSSVYVSICLRYLLPVL